jgi:hypothetical protein
MKTNQTQKAHHMERITRITTALPSNPRIHQSITPFRTALLATGTSAVWKYKAIYHLNDDPARRDGLWSDMASISVKG